MTEALHEPITMPRAGTEAPLATAPHSAAFPVDEVEELHSADWRAAAMVAGLMVSIFAMGMGIYLIVFACAMAGPP